MEQDDRKQQDAGNHSDGFFEKDARGRTVYYPWGPFGRGRIVPDSSTGDRLRKASTRFFPLGLPLCLAAKYMFGTGAMFVCLVLVIAGMVLYGWWIVSSLPLSEESATVGERVARRAEQTPIGQVRFGLIGGGLFALGGLVMVANGETAWDRLLGLLAVLFFGACSAAAGYMMKLKRPNP